MLSKEAKEYEDEFRDVMSSFQEHHEESDFDPLPTLNRIAEILEWASREYYAFNPDPLDNRHPAKILPNCLLGHVLKYLHRSTDFFDKAMITYLMPHERNEINVMSARVLVSSLPVMDYTSFTSDVIKELYNYALTSDSKELRAYSTILVHSAMTPETAHTYRTEIFRLIGDSLSRLNVLYDQMVNKDANSSTNETPSTTSGPTDFSQLQKEQNGEVKSQSGSKTEANKVENVETVATPMQASKKRQILEWDDTQNDIPAKRARSSNKKDPILPNSSERPVRNGGGCTPLADRFNDGLSNCSSTVDEMRRIIIGNNQIYPLTIEMEQRMILQFLQSVCEFTDHLRVLTENKALEIFMKYLNVNDYNDVRLLFDALFCLGTFLIHLRIAWEFVNHGGLQKLIAVNRQSMASVSVSVCLHHLSQFDDLMENICQGPGKFLDDIVEYSIWQLAHGHESSGARICGFLGYALQFKSMLDRFEQMDGLRVLYNYASSRINEFLEPEFYEGLDDFLKEKVSEFSIILRNTGTVLQRYMISHVLLKYESIKRHHNTRIAGSSTRMALKDLHKKPLVLEESEPKALELLLNTLPFIGSWYPANALHNLGFINFIIRIIGTRPESFYSDIKIKPEAIKMLLNTLRLATLSPGIINDLCENVSVMNSNETGIGILLDLIESDSYEDSELVKLTLRTLVHCFCGPELPALHANSSTGLLSSSYATTPSADKFRSPADAVALLSQKRISKHPRYFHDDNKIANVLKRAWQCGQTKNAIMVLIAYIRQPTPIIEADSMRALSCRALVGLARHEPIRQILSQLPLIVNNEIAVLLREPILQDKHAEHLEFRNLACKLIQIIHKTPIEFASQDITLERMWKTSVIKQTNIRYDGNELLKLIQDHLRTCGLNATADQLEQEAGPLSQSMLAPSKSLIMPKSQPIDANRTIDFNTSHLDSSANESMNSEQLNDSINLGTPKSEFPKTSLPSSNSKNFKNMKSRHSISFSTPKSIMHGRTLSESKRRTIGNSSLLAQSTIPFNEKQNELPNPFVQQPVQLKPLKSLGEIMTDYFRHQHAECEKPIVTCPPFSFYFQHHCPKPKANYLAPMNVVNRFLSRQVLPMRQTHQMFNRHDRNMMFSHYSVVRSFDIEEEAITACNLSCDGGSVQLGTYSGDLHWINLETGATEATYQCHNSMINTIKQSDDGSFLLTSSILMPPYSALWKLGESLEPVHTFNDDTYMSFGNLNNDHLIGTNEFTANVYDTETGNLVCSLFDSNIANKYERNKARFNCTDSLVLNDGIIWDLRANPAYERVHKFDKLSHQYSGIFHPNDLEVLICGQVWDVRTHKLLVNVPSLESCEYYFNKTGDILFALAMKQNDEEYDDRVYTTYESSFRVFDSTNYHVVTTFDTKREIVAFCPDNRDRHICTVESARDEETLCKIYEIGKIRHESEENEEDDDDNESPDEDEEDFSSQSEESDSGSEVDLHELVIDNFGNLIEQPVEAEDSDDDDQTDEGDNPEDDLSDEYEQDDAESVNDENFEEDDEPSFSTGDEESDY